MSLLHSHARVRVPSLRACALALIVFSSISCRVLYGSDVGSCISIVQEVNFFMQNRTCYIAVWIGHLHRTEVPAHVSKAEFLV